LANLLDDANGTFLVIVNLEGQHSLWPESVAVPEGWSVAHPADTRQNCLHYIKEHSTGMRPAGACRCRSY
jgi:MbtH protein